MLQTADLYLYRMAKAGYDGNYKPYLALMRAGRLFDSVLSSENRPLLGSSTATLAAWTAVNKHRARFSEP